MSNVECPILNVQLNIQHWTFYIQHSPHLYFLTSSGTFSGVTDSMTSSSTSTGVAKPQAPRHSTSITVHLPSGLVAPSSLAPVASSKAFTTASAPQTLHGDVVHTCTKCFPTGCW